MQAAALTHAPLALHVCGRLPEHCFALGVHRPVHAPATQAWLVQAPLTHAPAALHVWGVLPMHCVSLGVHTPVHAPLTQAWLVQPVDCVPQTPSPVHVGVTAELPEQVAAPHEASEPQSVQPFAGVSQVWVSVPEQRFAPRVQTLVQVATQSPPEHV